MGVSAKGSITALLGWAHESLTETPYPDCTGSLAGQSHWLPLAEKKMQFIRTSNTRIVEQKILPFEFSSLQS